MKCLFKNKKKRQSIQQHQQLQAQGACVETLIASVSSEGQQVAAI